MKTFITLSTLLAVTIMAFVQMGWVALLVVPAGILFALMTFTPLLAESLENEAVVAQPDPVMMDSWVGMPA